MQSFAGNGSGGKENVFVFLENGHGRFHLIFHNLVNVNKAEASQSNQAFSPKSVKHICCREKSGNLILLDGITLLFLSFGVQNPGNICIVLQNLAWRLRLIGLDD